MLSFLNKPYRETGNSKSTILSILAFGMFIFLFLFLFKPFGLYQFKPLNRMLITLGFGLITSTVLLVFKFLFKPAVTRKHWTIGKCILWDLLVACSIGVANYLFITLLFKSDFRPMNLLDSIWIAILVGSIPVTISYLIGYNKMYRNALKEANIPSEKIAWEEEVIITAGYNRNRFVINPGNIVYLCSNDNYVTIILIKDKVQSKITLRGTLKAAESELRKNNLFIRCHKCYIVNRCYVDKISGNNQNMKILLNSSKSEIPVARSKAEFVRKELKDKIYPYNLNKDLQFTP